MLTRRCPLPLISTTPSLHRHILRARCGASSTCPLSTYLLTRTGGTRLRLTRNWGYVLPRAEWQCRRSFFSASLPAYFVPPAVFVGLLLTLWFYKCCMMIIFQSKIIYMPSVPPFSRSEKIEDYVKACRPIQWREERIRSLDGTELALCISSMHATTSPMSPKDPSQGMKRKQVVILYFQGNGSSLPPRLPLLSAVLENLNRLKREHTPVDYTMIAVSYRGYWKSRGRASQPGIKRDSLAALQWTLRTLVSPEETRLVLWEQSIGAGVAVDLAARWQETEEGLRLPIQALLLETPFLSIRSMLTALYPQKWLPYRYLWPFLRSHWDSETAFRLMVESNRNHKPRVHILNAGNDEVVPQSQAAELECLCRALGYIVSRDEISGALHNDASTKGKNRIVNFLSSLDNS